MATILAPVDAREVVRCDQCQLVQFLTSNNLCRRCRASLNEDEPEPEPHPSAERTPVVLPSSSDGNGPPGRQLAIRILAMRIRWLRQRQGLSQSQLAMRMRVPRASLPEPAGECPPGEPGRARRRRRKALGTKLVSKRSPPSRARWSRKLLQPLSNSLKILRDSAN